MRCGFFAEFVQNEAMATPGGPMHIATKSRGRHSGKASMRSPAEVEAKKFTKQLGRRRRLSFLVPDKTNVHAGDVGSHRSQLDALAVGKGCSGCGLDGYRRGDRAT